MAVGLGITSLPCTHSINDSFPKNRLSQGLLEGGIRKEFHFSFRQNNDRGWEPTRQGLWTLSTISFARRDELVHVDRYTETDLRY